MKCGSVGSSPWNRPAAGGFKGMTRWDEASLKPSQLVRRATAKTETMSSLGNLIKPGVKVTGKTGED